jgi:hypothetical protein
MDRFSWPIDVIVDKKNDSIIICDFPYKGVIRWPRRGDTKGQIIISDIHCWGLAMDNNGDLYIADYKNNEVRRWKIGDTNGSSRWKWRRK